MKMVMVSYLHGFGGAEKQIVMLANAMAERGHEVVLISMVDDNRKYLLDEKVKYYFLPDRCISILRVVTRYHDLKKKLKLLNPEVTINFWFQSAYFTAIMNKNITGKVIYSERGDPKDKEYNGVLGIVRKAIFPKINGFVFQSYAAQRFFDEKIRNKSVVISNPIFVEADDYPKIQKRRKVIVSVGRLHAQKNQKMLIEAFSDISDNYPEYNLEIYGEGELKDYLQEMIDSLGLSKRVFLKGTSCDVLKLIYDASLFILSSNYEGFPNALLEAMSLGIPCISTDFKPGAVREIITNGFDGYIVPLGNVKEMEKRIKIILDNESLCRELSTNAKKSTKRFCASRIYDMWESFIGGL